MMRLALFVVLVLTLVPELSARDSISYPYNSARIRMFDVPGSGEECRGLADIEYTLLNGSPSASRFGAPFVTGQFLLTKDVGRIRLAPEYALKLQERIMAEVQNDPSVSDGFKLYNRDGTVEDFTHLLDASDGFMKLIEEFSARKTDRILEEARIRFEAEHRRIVENYTANLSVPSGNRTNQSEGQRGSLFLSRNLNLKSFYTRQRSPKTCYAASLDTAFRYLGLNGRYDDFVRRRSDFCPGSRVSRTAARFNEIMSVAYSSVLDKPTRAYNFEFSRKLFRDLVKSEYMQYETPWGIQEDYSWSAIHVPRVTGQSVLDLGSTLFGLPRFNFGQNQAPHIQAQTQNRKFVLSDGSGNPVSLWRPITWHRVNNPRVGGYIQPLMNTGNLVYEFWQNSVIMVGLSGREEGHTVIITGLEYSPGIDITDEKNGTINSETLITKIWVLDPAGGQNPEREIVKVGEFFSQISFAIAINDGVPPKN